MGGVVKNVVGAVGDVASGVGDVIQDVVIDPVVELGSNLEDGVREVVDEADKLVQNPLVQTVVSAINPAAGAFLNAYATLDSGENLSPAQIAALGAAGYTTASGTTLPPEVSKALKAGGAIAEGQDPALALIGTYGEDFVSELGLDTRFNESISSTFGQDALDLVKDNIDYVEAGTRIALGEDPSQVVASKFGDDIVGLLGSTDPTVNALGFAGLKTAVGLDQGLDAQDALLAGGEEYYKRGGQLPDLNSLGTIAGVDLGNIDFGDTGFISDIYNRTIGALPDMPDAPDLAFIEDFIRTNAPDVSLGDLDFSGFKAVDLGFGDLQSLANSGINLRGVDFEGVDLPDFDINLPEFDLDFGMVQQPQMVTGVEQPQEDEDETSVMLGTEQVPIDELLLADLAFRNPLLRS